VLLSAFTALLFLIAAGATIYVEHLPNKQSEAGPLQRATVGNQ
jgi:hypothetical protein